MIAETYEAIESNVATNETRLVAALTTAFAADPAVRWLYPDAQQYLQHSPDFVRAFAGKAFAHDTADELEDYSAAALWLPPKVQPNEVAVLEVLHRGVNESRLLEALSIFEQMDGFHPHEPHWYLPMIGVDPAQQGRGCGSALLRNGIARCDADRLPAYLVATNLRTVAFYERFGFKVAGQIKTQTSPAIIPMIRPAQ